MLSDMLSNLAITTKPLSPAGQLNIVNSQWSANISLESVHFRRVNIGPYLDYYFQQCDLFSIEQDGQSFCSDSSGSEPMTHGEMLEICKQLTNGNDDRESILQRLESQRRTNTKGTSGVPDSHIIFKNENETLIDWAARLRTMVEIGRLQCAFSSRRSLEWQEGSLRDFVARIFTPAKPEEGQVKLEKTFNAHNLERFTGMKIEWTNDLASHLSLRDDDTKVLIFHHASFLENLAESDDLFPPSFRAETLRTLALLLPSADKDTRKWFRKQQAACNLDSRACSVPHLRADNRRIENFYYWRERIVILKQVFDEAEPSTLSQWWHDRRRGPQWYTFWVAVTVLALTIFFGLVQALEGAMQVYLTMASLRQTSSR